MTSGVHFSQIILPTELGVLRKVVLAVSEVVPDL